MTKEDLNLVEKAAVDLMFLFIMNSNDKGNVTGEGLARLSERFGDVPVENRADVYKTFTNKLIERGIKFDQTQFGY